jgi:rfaE bifunctional protein nucleotidyltransferase chain/domain
MLIHYEDLSLIRENHSKESLVLVGGCYDLFHLGHVLFLQKCKSYGDILVVATSSDKRIRERKGISRPIIREKDRVRVLASLSDVNYALIAPEPEKFFPPPTVRILDALKPDIFTTSDTRLGEYSEELQKKGIRVVYVEPARKPSTTKIIQRILNRYQREPS